MAVPERAAERWHKVLAWVTRRGVIGLLIFIALALILRAFVDEHITVGPTTELSGFAQHWSTSPGIRSKVRNGIRYISSSGPETVVGARGASMPRGNSESRVAGIASRLLRPPVTAQFLALTVCLEGKMPELPSKDEASRQPAVAVMLASVRDGKLDFNRQFATHSLLGNSQTGCHETRFPRRVGDGSAVLQMQFLAPDSEIALSSLRVTPLREAPVWKWTRMLMLSLGLLCVVQLFASHASFQRPLRSALVLGSIGAILFGCCVPVGLKADIFALGSGGRMSPVFSSAQDMLGYVFPMAGFSVFTALHTVLFAIATTCVGLLRPRREILADMLLFAVTTEILQIFVPGRGPGVRDIMIDALGIVIGGLLLFLLWRSQRVCLLLQDKGVNKDVSGLR